MAEKLQENLAVVEQNEVKGEVATKVQFGAFNAPTPKNISRAFDIFFWATGVITLALNTFTWIDPASKDILNQCVIVAIFAARGLAKSFGVVIDEK